MSKGVREDDYEMEPEYDFSIVFRIPMLRGFVYEQTWVVLDADVSVAFPDSQSVNEALRLLIKAAKNVKDVPKAS